MHCPNCKERKGIELDIHSDGYAKGLFECASCGTLWLEKSDRTVTVKQAA